MKKIPLSKGLVTVVDDEDFEWLSQYKWFAAAASGCEDLHYAVRNVPAPETKHGHRLLRMHIAIMGASGIDHRDGRRPQQPEEQPAPSHPWPERRQQAHAEHQHLRASRASGRPNPLASG